MIICKQAVKLNSKGEHKYAPLQSKSLDPPPPPLRHRANISKFLEFLVRDKKLHTQSQTLHRSESGGM